MPLQSIQIDATDPAAPRVEVAGVDVSVHADRTVLVLERGALPRVVLEFSAEADAKALAEVVAVDVSGLPSIKDWLSSLDPGQVESAALELTNGLDGGCETTGQAFLVALIGMAP